MSKYLILFFLISFQSFEAQDLKQLYKKSIEAYENKNFVEFREMSAEALKIHPSQPALLYNLALSHHLNQNNAAAFKTLELLLTWNAKLNYISDKDFENFLKDINYAKTLAQKRNELLKSYSKSTLFFETSNKYHIEDFSIDGDYLYTTDLHRGILTKFNKKLNFIEDNIYFKSAPLALVNSEDNTHLFVSTSMLANYKSFDKKKENQTDIFKIRVSDFRIVKQISLREKSIIGSMTQHKGKIYASNSLRPEIIIFDENSLEVLETIQLKKAYNLQGITINKEKEILYIADYIKGVYVMHLNDLDAETTATVNVSNYLLKGIDGLVYNDKSKSLFATQNNSTPNRCIQITFSDKSQRNFSEVIIIDNLSKNIGEPTNIKHFDDKVFYISNSQWPFYNNKMQPKYQQWNPQKIMHFDAKNY